MASYEWEDPALDNFSTRFTGWYKCKLGHQDVVMIADKYTPVQTHSWQQNGKYMASPCSMEQSKKCPYCERADSLLGHKLGLKHATSVLHITRAPLSGKAQFVGKLLAWRFGDDKLVELRQINLITGNKLLKTPIAIMVKGTEKEKEQFQDLTMKNLDAKAFFGALSKMQKKTLEEALQEDNKEKVKALYLPTYEDLVKFMRDDEEAMNFEPDKMLIEPGNVATGTIEQDNLFDADENENEEEEESKSSKKSNKGKAKKIVSENSEENPFEGMFEA